jgi:hypothetical protein
LKASSLISLILRTILLASRGLWTSIGGINTLTNKWPSSKLTLLTDTGGFNPTRTFASLVSNGSHLLPTSNLALSPLDKKCLAGCEVLERPFEGEIGRKLMEPIGNIMIPPQPQRAYPSSISNIEIGSVLVLDAVLGAMGNSIEEVTVTTNQPRQMLSCNI